MTEQTPRERARELFIDNWGSWATYIIGCVTTVFIAILSAAIISPWAYLPISAGLIVLWDMATPALQTGTSTRSWRGDGILYYRLVGDRE